MTDGSGESGVETRKSRREDEGGEVAKTARAYSGFNGQYIVGSWRPGKQGGVRKDTDPYSGETLAEIVMVDASDLDEAYQSAQKAQVAWTGSLRTSEH